MPIEVWRMHLIFFYSFLFRCLEELEPCAGNACDAGRIGEREREKEVTKKAIERNVKEKKRNRKNLEIFGDFSSSSDSPLTTLSHLVGSPAESLDRAPT